MTTDEKLAAILAAVQTDPGNRGLARDPVENLFTACPEDFALAAQRIANDPGSGIAILTGFYIPTAEPPASETDGPLGAIRLAQTFAMLGQKVVLITDLQTEPALIVGLRHLGLYQELVVGSERFTLDNRPRIVILTVPPPRHPWYVFQALDWHSVLQTYAINHVVSVERVGPSRQDGRPYSMRALDLSEYTAPMHHLVEECQRMTPRIHTVGIGDGGNEIGMGKVSWNTIHLNIQNGAQIACRLPTDHLIVAGVSNWGAYALAAGVFAIREIQNSIELFDPILEKELLELMVYEGPLVDGVTGKQSATVDGLSWDEYIRPMIRIREIVQS